MSTPISSIASTAAGLISSAGVEPAERTWIRPPDRSSTRPAAIWLRPALWVQTNRTSGCSFTSLPSACARPAAADRSLAAAMMTRSSTFLASRRSDEAAREAPRADRGGDEARGRKTHDVRREACTASVAADSSRRSALAVLRGGLGDPTGPNLLHRLTVARVTSGVGCSVEPVSPWARETRGRASLEVPPLFKAVDRHEALLGIGVDPSHDLDVRLQARAVQLRLQQLVDLVEPGRDVHLDLD